MQQSAAKKNALALQRLDDLEKLRFEVLAERQKAESSFLWARAEIKRQRFRDELAIKVGRKWRFGSLDAALRPV